MDIHRMMTPEEALGRRDVLLKCLLSDTRLIDDAGKTDPLSSDVSNWVNAAAKTAALVIWQLPLWKAAQAGSSAFEGVRVHPSDCPIGNQIWLFSDVRFIASNDVYSPSSEDFLLGLMVAGSPDKGLIQIQFWETASRDFRILTAPFQSIDEECKEGYSCVLAGLRFMQMEFVTQTREVLPRHLRRAAELGRRPPLPEIKTITLRRAVRDDRPHEDGGEPREWSCSWLVGAHWRKQLCKSLTKPGEYEYRPCYVKPYVKGDLSKPLRQPKGPVYVVSR